MVIHRVNVGLVGDVAPRLAFRGRADHYVEAPEMRIGGGVVRISVSHLHERRVAMSLRISLLRGRHHRTDTVTLGLPEWPGHCVRTVARQPFCSVPKLRERLAR